MLLGQGLRIVVQGVYFVLIARTLGTTEYGAIVAVMGAVGVAAPFAALGSGNLMIMNVARDPRRFAHYWARGLLMTGATSALLVVLILGAATAVLPSHIPLSLVLCLATADIAMAKWADLGGQAYQAFQRLDRTAFLQLLLSVARLLAALALVLFVPHPSAASWGLLYLGSTVLAALVAVLMTSVELGWPRAEGRGSWREMVDGFHFSITQSAQSIYNDIDKVMLARMASLAAAGVYGAAYRILDVSFVPIRSVLYASYAQFFQAGANGLASTVGMARRLIRLVGLYSLGIGLAILAFASIVPRVLGAEYSNAVPVLRGLCVLPLLKTLHYFAADALTGAGYQSRRSLSQVVVAAFNIVVNLWLIPRYSWRGAVWSSVASDAALVLLLWSTVAWLARRERQLRTRPTVDDQLAAMNIVSG